MGDATASVNRDILEKWEINDVDADPMSDPPVVEFAVLRAA
jgi:hypothetical protein